MKNLLVSGDIKEKIGWYIKAHGHSSIGGLNLISTYFSFHGKQQQADVVEKAIGLFQNFADSDDLEKQLKDLESAILDVEKVIREEQIEEEKRSEMLDILGGVKKNISMIDKIIKNPGYEEKFKLSKILFSTSVQLLKQYPNVLHGDLVGDKGKDVGDRIKLNFKEPLKEKKILCCGYEMQLLLFNLLSNAVDAVKDKGNIYINMKYGKRNIGIDVSDDGKLISAKDIQKIVKHRKFSTKGRSHGAGLKIVYDILGKYKGKMNVKSNPITHLVTFSVQMPLRS